jgi:DNA polymerase-3 subunit epsilon
MREIVLDTETTGLDPATGDRIVEIGCIELINRLPTENMFHVYINPERDMPKEAEAVHGLSAKRLAGEPKFAEIADDFLAFIGDAPLIIHNASFDMKFINAELKQMGKAILPFDRTIDTLAMARKKFPGAPASLDALCRRFGVDNTNRDLHGALIDSELLAAVYLELSGGRQPGLVFQAGAVGKADGAAASASNSASETSHDATLLSPRQPQRRREKPLSARLTEGEKAAHAAFLDALPQRAIWRRGAGEES